MPSHHGFRPDLYRGTAPFYDAYRPPYPGALFADLGRHIRISGTGRLLDLACGAGQVALALADLFAEVWAVDQEAESVAQGRSTANARAIDNITWITGRAETASLDGPFEIVGIGNASTASIGTLSRSVSSAGYGRPDAWRSCGAASPGSATGLGRLGCGTSSRSGSGGSG